MTKTFYFLLLILILASCSKKDDTGSDDDMILEIDLIIGNWKPIKQVDFFEDSTSETYNYSTCQQQSRYIFESNGIYDFFNYNTDINGNCVITQVNPKFVEGVWEKLSEGVYKFTSTYFNSDTQQTEIQIYTSDEISFIDQNRMQWRVNTNDIVNGVVREYYYTEFIKI